MAIQVLLKLDCPLCPGEENHESIARLNGLPVLPCPSVTPVGDLRYFPIHKSHGLKGLFLIGAGLGVNVEPAHEPSEAELRAELAALEQEEARKQAAAAAAADAAAMKAKIDALKAGTYVPEPEKPSDQMSKLADKVADKKSNGKDGK